VDDEATAKSTFRGWRGLAVLVLGCFLLGLALLYGWYQSNADLDDIRAQAVEMDLPVSWSEVHLALASLERQRLYERLGQLTPQLQSYEWMRTKLGTDTTPAMPWARYADPPASALAYHASLNPDLLAELLSTLDRLGSSPLVLRVDFPMGADEPELYWKRQLMSLLAERVRLAKSDILSLEVGRLLRLLEIADIRTQNHLNVQSSLLSVAVSGLATRTDELKNLDPTLIERLAAVTNDLLLHAQNAYVGLFISAFDGLSHRSPGEVARLLESDNWPWMDRWLAAPMIRIERQRFLRWTLENAVFLKREHRLDMIIEESRRLTARSRGLISGNQINSIHLRLGNDSGYFHRSLCLVIMQSRLLVAEVTGSPWPKDDCASGSPPLRRIERDSRLMGAYSVGEDGIDDGGDKKKDRYFPLYGPLEPPTSSPVP
jgi:hypothetical protein